MDLFGLRDICCLGHRKDKGVDSEFIPNRCEPLYCGAAIARH